MEFERRVARKVASVHQAQRPVSHREGAVSGDVGGQVHRVASGDYQAGVHSAQFQGASLPVYALHQGFSSDDGQAVSGAGGEAFEAVMPVEDEGAFPRFDTAVDGHVAVDGQRSRARLDEVDDACLEVAFVDGVEVAPVVAAVDQFDTGDAVGAEVVFELKGVAFPGGGVEATREVFDVQAKG